MQRGVALIFLFCAGLAGWALLDVDRFGAYLLPWNWSAKHEKVRKALVRATAILSLVAALRMLMKAFY